MTPQGVRIGIADHFGWAIAVTAAADHAVIDRRRITLIEPGFSEAPIHYDRGRSDLATLASLVASARESVRRATTAALDELASSLNAPVESVSLRTWPQGFPDEIDVLRRPPYEARADAIMYRRILADCARERGWAVHFYDAKHVIAQATAILGPDARATFDLPRATLGPPWTNDHRVTLAATVMASVEARR